MRLRAHVLIPVSRYKADLNSKFLKMIKEVGAVAPSFNLFKTQIRNKAVPIENSLENLILYVLSSWVRHLVVAY